MKTKSQILAIAKKIKLFACDVDGVLTHGEVLVLNSGEEIKAWNVKDGTGFSELKKTFPRIRSAWITGRQSQQVETRANHLDIDFLVQGCANKRVALEAIIAKTGFELNEIAFIGDDIIDIPILKRVGFSICPKDGASDVKKVVDYVSSFNGGDGVAREVIEMIMKAKGEWKKVLERYNL